MKKIAIAVVVLVALVVLAIALVPSFLDINRYRGQIQAELQQRLGRPVTLGQMRLRVLPLSLRVENVEIAEDPKFGSGSFAQARELYVMPKLLPLLRKEVAISALELRRPHIELIRNRQGVWNFSTLGQQTAPSRQAAPKAAPQQPQAPPSAGVQQQFALDKLSIIDGQVAFTDLQKRQATAVYDHIDLTVKDYAPGKPASLKLAAHLPGEGKQKMELDARAGPFNDATPLMTPLDGTLRLEQVSLSGLQKFANVPALAGIDGIISGVLAVKNESGRLASTGNLKIEDGRVRGLAVGYPVAADYKLTDDLNQDVINIEQGTIKLGATPLTVTGAVNTRPTPAQVNIHLTAKDASLEEAARLASAFGVAFTPGDKITGKLNADVNAQGAADKPALNGSLSARDLNISGKDAPQPVKVPAIDLALTPQQVRSNEFTATAGSTRLDGRFTLSQYTTASPLVDAVLRTSNAQIAELLSIARAYGVQAAPGMTGSGVLSLDVTARGPVKNTSALVFSGSGVIRNASLKPATLTQPLNIGRADLQFTQNSVVAQNLAASLGQTNATGNVTVRNFAAPQLQFVLNADKVNVAELRNITSAAPQTPAQRTSLVPAAHAAKPEPSLLALATGTGTVSISNVLYDQLVLTNLRANVVLDHGIIRMNPVTAQVFGGQETGSITIDTRPTPASVQMAMKLQNVDSNKLISSVTSIKETVYGMLAANSQGSFQATDANNIARTLNGRLSLNLNNGRIAGIDLLNQLASIGKFVGANFAKQPFTNVAKLTGDFVVQNGVATTNNLQGQIEGGTIAANGAVNLVNESLDMRLTAVLSKAFSQQVGGTGIGGFMSTTLANKNGELVMPVLVSGTFQQPRFAPDVQAIAQMKLQNLLPSTSNPAAGVLGNILGGKSGTPAGQQQQDGIGGILGAITGEQKNQQQQQQQQQRQNQTPPPAAGQQQQNPPRNPLQEALEGLIGGKKK